MSVVVNPTDRQLDNLAALAALTDYVGAKLHLYSNDLIPDKDSVVADFTAVLASGVTAVTVTYSAPFYDSLGVPTITCGEKLFVQTGATNDVCYGAYLTNTAGTKLLAAARLDVVPFNFNGEGAALLLLLKLTLAAGLLSISPVP